jgi:hypothetical protein
VHINYLNNGQEEGQGQGQGRGQGRGQERGQERGQTPIKCCSDIITNLFKFCDDIFPQHSKFYDLKSKFYGFI